MGYAALPQPIGQLILIVSEGPKASLLFTALPLGLRPQHTRCNTLLVHVQTTAARIDHFHRISPFYRLALDASKKRKSPMRALRNFRRLQFVVLPSVPAILVRGLCEHQSETASVANAAAQTLRHLELIFILRCGSPRAMGYSYLRATMGSTRIARRAGKYPATSATADSTPTATAIVYVSCAAMPNNKLCNKRTEPSATPTPIATPTTRISSTSRNTSLKIDPGCAPSAIRTPNSVCRCVTR